jgi:phytoene dehydrogenase-like protein
MIGDNNSCSMREPDPGRDERRKDIQEQVFQSPALFGSLLAAAELNNPVSRRYEHHLCRDFPDDGDSILRQMHVEVFAEWLNFRLEQQEKDIRLWLHWLGRTPEDTADLLKRVQKRASELIPQQYRREPERTLFLSDLRVVVGLVDLRYSAGQETSAQYPI